MTRTDRLRRLRAALWMLEENQNGITAHELARRLDVSTRTARRDLLTLRATGYPLASVGARWQFIEGQPLATALAADGAGQASERDRTMILDRAIRQRHPAEVQFWSLGPGGPVLLRLAPLKLSYIDGSLFLIAREYPQGQLRTLPVERLAQVKLLSKRFSRQLEKGLEDYLANASQAHASAALVRVTVRLRPHVSWRVSERIWHPSQRVVIEDDGSALVTLKVPGFAWVKAWVLGFGADAIVVAPSELISVICMELEKTCRRYSEERRWRPQLDLFAEQK